VVRVVQDPEGGKLADPQLVQTSDTQGLSVTAVLTADEAKDIKELA
jgi:hypothetical protein